VDVLVGARAGGGGEARARSHGFPVAPLAEAARRARVLSVLLPDEILPDLWEELSTPAQPRAAFVFAHGFNLLYGGLRFPDTSDVVLVSPAGPGRILRERYRVGLGLPAYLAVAHDASGTAWSLAERYATGLGSARARLWRTTVREETEVDLFGEQAVLCGGMNALVTTAFEVLIAAGYSAEMAYLECVHQLKYLADLLHERGVAGMRRGISGTALFGDLTRGPRVVGGPSRSEMERMLAEIRSGAFAREWLAEVAAGRERVDEQVERARGHPIESARVSALLHSNETVESEASREWP
jgi:ketol-acid reductoisomerase